MRLGGLPPDEVLIRGQIEYMKETGKQAPPRQPGDKFPIIGLLIGVVAGVIIAILTGEVWVYIAGPIGGGILGTSSGSLVWTTIKRFPKRKDNLRYF